MPIGLRKDRDRLALPTWSDYLRPVKLLRALTLLCFSFGLFVQVAAQAAAPQGQLNGMAECAEMAQAMPEQMGAEMASLDGQGPCPDMTIDCLVVMNCVPPLALSRGNALQTTPLPVAPLYLSASVVRLESEPLLPESPPPQSILTV